MRSAKRGSAAGAAISRLVHPLNQITSLLKFNREKVGSRDIDPFQLHAGLIGAAGSDLIDPKRQAICIGRSIQEVVIVLADKVRWIIDDVRGRLACIVDDRYRGDCRSAKSSARRIAQVDIKSFISLDVRIVVDEHDKALRSLAGRKTQRPDGGDVIAAL